MAPRQRLIHAFAALRRALTEGQLVPWADPRAQVTDPLHELELLVDMFCNEDTNDRLRDLRARTLAAALEQGRLAFHSSEDRRAAGARVAAALEAAGRAITTASGYEMLLDAALTLAALPADEPEPADEPWFALPKLLVDVDYVRSPPSLLRILARLLQAWGDWDDQLLERQTLAPALRACLDAEVLADWGDEDEERLLWVAALRFAIEGVLAERDPKPIELTELELACAVVDRIRDRLEQLDELAEPRDEDELPELEAWEHVWLGARLTHDVELATEIHAQYNEAAQMSCGQGDFYVTKSPASHMPALLSRHLCDYYIWDLRSGRDEARIGMLAEFPDAIELLRSSEHFAAGTAIAVEALELLDYPNPAARQVARETLLRYQQQLEPLRDRLAGCPILAELEELGAALAELLAAN